MKNTFGGANRTIRRKIRQREYNSYRLRGDALPYKYAELTSTALSGTAVS